MNHLPRITFDDALETAITIVKNHWNILGPEVLLVRDLLGRLRVVLPGERQKATCKKVKTFSKTFAAGLGRYAHAAEKSVLFSTDLTMGDSLFSSNSPDRKILRKDHDKRLWLLDRQLTGADWERSQLPRTTQNHRVTFFGIKGGVGRSTALVVWAWWLAKQGKHVLVLDFDLESPGITSTLMPLNSAPDFGVVDWLVEDGIGQCDVVESSLVTTSPLSKGLAGDIRVVPAFGRKTEDYLPKLSRSLSDFSGKDTEPWGERVQRMVERLEIAEKPDLVIFDSRAGLQDIAAVLVTRMDADTFLFAIDSMQTWTAYRFLFWHWKDHPQLAEFRERLQIVAGMAPETGRDEYLERFTDRSWDLFRDHLYDEIPARDADGFTFDRNDQDAPHYPLTVFWTRALQEFEPAVSNSGIDEQVARAAMEGFLLRASKMAFPEEKLS